jgi:hypothetical protein
LEAFEDRELFLALRPAVVFEPELFLEGKLGIV